MAKRALIWLVAIMALSRVAQATEPVRVVYAAHAGCPAVEAFIAGVSRRTDKARWVARDEARRFEVQLTRGADGGTDGALRIVDPSQPGAPPGQRSIAGADCGAVVDALALVAALAIDPAASLVPKPPPAPPPPPPPPPPPAPPPVVADPAVWRWMLGAHIGAVSGFGDALSTVVPLFVDVGRYRAGWLAPSFRAGASFMLTRSVARAEGSASFTRFTGRLSGCPVALGNDAVAFRPCAGVEAGVVHATRDDMPLSQNAGWLSFHLLGRLQWFPVDWLLVEAEGEGGVPVVRPRYHLEPDLTLLELSPVYGAFALGVGVRFE